VGAVGAITQKVSKENLIDASYSHPRGGGTWWQGMAAAIPIFEVFTTICHSLPYQYLRILLGPATPIF